MGSSGAGGLEGLVGPGGLSRSPTASKSNYRVIIFGGWGAMEPVRLVGLIGPGGLGGSPNDSNSNY
jgi:hypothetical protein